MNAERISLPDALNALPAVCEELAPIVDLSQRRLPQKRIGTRIIRKINGCDVRVTAPVLPDGTTIFDHQPGPEEIEEAMMTQLDPGIRQFNGYPYDVQLLNSTLISCEEDAIGNRHWIGSAYLLGDHYQNGVGNMIPKDKAWNHNENETKAYISLSTTPWEPGIVYGSLVHTGTDEWRQASSIERRYEQNEDYRKSVQAVAQTVFSYRDTVGKTGQLTSMAAD